MQQYDVGVVGYGACSAVLVNLLLERGLKVVVLEKDKDVLATPRAAHFDDETLRSFQVLGAADELSASFTTSANYVVYNLLDQPVWGLNDFSTEPTDQGWLSDYFFFQPDFEHYLRDKALSSGITAKLQCEVTDIEQRDDDVVVTYHDLAKGDAAAPEQLSVRYLIGADGAASYVRRHLGIEMEQLATSQRWLIVDIKAHDGVEASLLNSCWTRVGTEGTVTYVPMPRNIHRFEHSVQAHQTEQEVTAPEAITAFLSTWFAPGTYDVLRADVYHFHSLVAQSWREGRIFLAGDAAHLMPPFLGQGVCTAIRDAMNLAWKLARVVKGESSSALLDTYESERRPHARTFVNAAGQVGEKIKWMSTATPDQLATMQAEEHGVLRPPLGPGVHSAQARGAGVLGPQPRLDDGGRLDDRVGYNFAVVGDPATIDAISPETKARLTAVQAVFVPDDGTEVRTALTSLGGSVMVLRPDHYLLGVATDAGEIDALVSGLAAPLVAEPA